MWRTGVAKKPAPADVPKFVGEHHDTFVRRTKTEAAVVDGDHLTQAVVDDLVVIGETQGAGRALRQLIE